MTQDEVSAKLLEVLERLAKSEERAAQAEQRAAQAEKAIESVKAQAVAPPAKDRPKAWIPVAGEVSCYVKGDKVDYTAIVRCERRFTDNIGGRVPWGNSGQPVADHVFNAAHVRDIIGQRDEFLRLAQDAETALSDEKKRAAALKVAKERIAASQAKAGLRKSGAAKLI